MDNPVATLLFGAFLTSPLNYLPADGKCLIISEHLQLADSLRDGDTWPYGKCEGDLGFKIPKIVDENGNVIAIIKVN